MAHLIVEDGTGLTTANAYISVAFADTYHSDRATPGWSGDVEAKEAAIVVATEYIDRHFDFQGDRITIGDGENSIPAQALAWPRRNVLHPDGFVIDPAAVPVQVQRATAELALAALCGPLEPTVAGGYLTSVTERVGRVSTSQDFGGAGSGADEYPVVHAILRPLLVGTGGFGTTRLLRA